MRWTTERVAALSPDPAALAAAGPIARVERWRSIGRSERAIWGEYGGSATSPYRVQLDLSDTAFSCSCPSRKIPCKHGLALALLLARDEAQLPAAEAPPWVEEWLAARARRAEKKSAREAEAGGVIDPETAARRAESREKRASGRERNVSSGVEELRRWLEDLLRQGLAAQSEHGQRWWDEMASRMIDAQAPGLARLVRQLSELPYTGTGWQERALERIGRLHLLLEAWDRRDALPPDHRADVDAMIGFTVSRESLLASEGAVDRWWVLGQRTILEERLRMRRTWLWGSVSRRHALILDFAAGTQALEGRWAPGDRIEVELAFHPGAWPLRALARDQGRPAPRALVEAREAFTTIGGAMELWGRAVAANPWLELLPLALREVVPVHGEEQWLLRDREGRELPVSRSFSRGWRLAAISGGAPIDVFGEWDGERLLPLGVFSSLGYDPIGAAPTGTLAGGE